MISGTDRRPEFSKGNDLVIHDFLGVHRQHRPRDDSVEGFERTTTQESIPRIGTVCHGVFEESRGEEKFKQKYHTKMVTDMNMFVWMTTADSFASIGVSMQAESCHFAHPCATHKVAIWLFFVNSLLLWFLFLQPGSCRRHALPHCGDLWRLYQISNCSILPGVGEGSPCTWAEHRRKFPKLPVHSTLSAAFHTTKSR